MPATISKARSSSVIFILCAMLLMMVGCGSSVKSSYVSGFTPAAGTRIRLGAITDSAPIERRGKKKDFDIRNELRNQLENQLSKAGLLATGTTTDPSVQLMVDITNYKPGDAFKRWLAPGWGQTKLKLECRLYERGSEVGTITASRYVAAGAPLTIGQWKTIFKDLSHDIVSNLKKKFKANR